jgi:hypothetical protein
MKVNKTIHYLYCFMLYVIHTHMYQPRETNSIVFARQRAATVVYQLQHNYDTIVV